MRYTSQIEPMDITSENFTPLGTQFLGKYKMELKSEGGILYGKPEDTWWAKVIRVGPDCEIEIGQHVLMSQYRGENIDMQDGRFVILDEKDAMAVEE